jgi:thioredoxin 1
MTTIALTQSTFVEEVKKPGVLVIDFWAAWCGPCRSFAPIFEKVADRHPEVRFAKVDTEAAPELASALAIRSIPTLMVVRDGAVIFAQAGALAERPLAGLVQWALRHEDGGRASASVEDFVGARPRT